MKITVEHYDTLIILHLANDISLPELDEKMQQVYRGLGYVIKYGGLE